MKGNKESLQSNITNSIQQKKLNKKSSAINFNSEKFNFSERLFSLPTIIVRTILKFLIKDYKLLCLISPLWYIRIHENLEEELIELDNKFIKKYSQYLLLQNSYMSWKNLTVSKKRGFRLDRNILAEVLPGLEGNNN